MCANESIQSRLIERNQRKRPPIRVLNLKKKVLPISTNHSLPI
jgi:hypothetical protein